MQLKADPSSERLTHGSDDRNVSALIYSALKERGHTVETIEQMSAREIFGEYCTWHGLINWSDTLWDVMLVLKAQR